MTTTHGGLAMLAVGASLFALGFVGTTPSVAAEKKPPGATQQIKPQEEIQRVVPRNCPDIAVTSFRVELVDRYGTNQRDAHVRFTAVAANVGKAAFVSSKGQQALHILEKPVTPGDRLLKERGFLRLNPGQSVTATVTREWHLGMEFPPSFIARISYDPDIYMDGNKQNDDCRNDNNSRTISADAVTALLN